MKLIIQIPAYNEEKTLAATLADLPRKIEGITSIETLIIDDGSTDGTVEAARRAGADHVVRLLSHRGLSTAFLAGIDASLRLGADIIVNTDADNQYRGADIAKLVRPILNREAELVVGDREVKSSPYMSSMKRGLQQLGSWAVGIASGVSLPDVTSGFRAFSREAAFQINVFNPFTYTLETIIQAGNKNFGIRSIAVATNAPTRDSRLYRGIGSYLRKSAVTIFRIYTLYKPLKTFFTIGAVLLGTGTILGIRFLYFFLTERSAGHVQSLILAAVLLIAGFHTILIGLLADLISVNRRLSEEILIRLKKLDPLTRSVPKPLAPPGRERSPARPQRQLQQQQRPPRREGKPAEGKPLETQWVWLLDEGKLDPPAAEVESPPPLASAAPVTAPAAAADSERRKRRRKRRGGIRHFGEMKGRHHPHSQKASPGSGEDGGEGGTDA